MSEWFVIKVFPPGRVIGALLAASPDDAVELFGRRCPAQTQVSLKAGSLEGVPARLERENAHGPPPTWGRTWRQERGVYVDDAVDVAGRKVGQ